ncbi:MAG: AbrB/MazE/SpoVT family DNA-binding domain-containing protein [Erysipelotrichaceae bacterium]|nr:AbrB/MazE/SpoVT family DNA-binding domain-containing protein [Erysipelotrichaceae bacterium]
MPVQVITMSTKGQIVLPSEMRDALSLGAGSKLAVFYEDGTIMLKPIAIPSPDDFRESLMKAQKWASEVGYVESDVASLIKEVRKG